MHLGCGIRKFYPTGRTCKAYFINNIKILFLFFVICTEHRINRIFDCCNCRKSTKKVRDLWWQGVPPNVRGKIWKLAIGNDLNITEELYEICVNRARDRIRLAAESASICSEDVDAAGLFSFRFLFAFQTSLCSRSREFSDFTQAG